jgi:hypothetical protein
MQMSKEYRAELRALNAASRKVASDLDKFVRQNNRQQQQLVLELKKADARASKALVKIDRRKAILEGRLS